MRLYLGMTLAGKGLKKKEGRREAGDKGRENRNKTV